MPTPAKRLPYEAMRNVREASIYLNYAINHVSRLAESLRDDPEGLVQLNRSLLAMSNSIRFLERIGSETMPPEADLEWMTSQKS